ncbi:bromodomain protein [Medicago truncatula]|uniref:Bromodomain protein n=1 Tax=Medicago truncatula TaxID=3880 RepID=G7ZYI2_MEDTR|nr:bromodomain protein [Medicago truncatula]
MDFGTMRAKAVEGKYGSLTEFKRDVFLLCVNARSVYPKTSRHHKVAENIRCHAIKIFEDLNAEHENVNMKVSSSKRCQSKKQHERQKRISPELLRRNNVTRSKVPETEKRFMCWPPYNKSLVSEFLNAKQPNIQEESEVGNYPNLCLVRRFPVNQPFKMKPMKVCMPEVWRMMKVVAVKETFLGLFLF